MKQQSQQLQQQMMFEQNQEWEKLLLANQDKVSTASCKKMNISEPLTMDCKITEASSANLKHQLEALKTAAPIFRKVNDASIDGGRNSFYRAVAFFYFETQLYSKSSLAPEDYQNPLANMNDNAAAVRQRNLQSLIISVYNLLSSSCMQIITNTQSIPSDLQIYVRNAHIYLIEGLKRVYKLTKDQDRHAVAEALREMFNNFCAFDLASILYIRCLALQGLDSTHQNEVLIASTFTQEATSNIIAIVAQQLNLSLTVNQFSPDEQLQQFQLGVGKYQSSSNNTQSNSNGYDQAAISTHLFYNEGQFDLCYSSADARKHYSFLVAQNASYSPEPTRSIININTFSKSASTFLATNRFNKTVVQSTTRKKDQFNNSSIQQQDLLSLREKNAKLQEENSQLLQEKQKYLQSQLSERQESGASQEELARLKNSYESQIQFLQQQVRDLATNLEQQNKQYGTKLEEAYRLRQEAEQLSLLRQSTVEQLQIKLEKVQSKKHKYKQQMHQSQQQHEAQSVEAGQKLKQAEEALVSQQKLNQQMKEELDSCGKKLKQLELTQGLKESDINEKILTMQSLENSLQKERLKVQLQENIIQQLKQKDSNQQEQHEQEKLLLEQKVETLATRNSMLDERMNKSLQKKKTYKEKLEKLGSENHEKNSSYTERIQQLIKMNEKLLAENSLSTQNIQSLAKQLSDSESGRLQAEHASCELQLKCRQLQQDLEEQIRVVLSGEQALAAQTSACTELQRVIQQLKEQKLEQDEQIIHITEEYEEMSREESIFRQQVEQEIHQYQEKAENLQIRLIQAQQNEKESKEVMQLVAEENQRTIIQLQMEKQESVEQIRIAQTEAIATIRKEYEEQLSQMLVQIEKLHNEAQQSKEGLENQLMRVSLEGETQKQEHQQIQDQMLQQQTIQAEIHSMTTVKLQERIDALNEQVNIQNEQIQALTEQTKILNEQNITLEQKNQTLIEQNQDLDKQNQTLNEQKVTIEQQNQALTEQNQSLDKQNQITCEQIQELGKQNQSLSQQIQAMQQEKEDLEQQLQELVYPEDANGGKKEAVKRQKNVQLSDLIERIETLEKALLESQQLNSSIQELLKNQEEEISGLYDQRSKIENQNQQLEQQNNQTKERITNLLTQIAQLQVQNEYKDNQNNLLKQTNIQLTDQNEKNISLIKKLESEKQAKELQIQKLKTKLQISGSTGNNKNPTEGRDLPRNGSSHYLSTNNSIPQEPQREPYVFSQTNKNRQNQIKPGELLLTDDSPISFCQKTPGSKCLPETNQSLFDKDLKDPQSNSSFNHTPESNTSNYPRFATPEKESRRPRFKCELFESGIPVKKTEFFICGKCFGPQNHPNHSHHQRSVSGQSPVNNIRFTKQLPHYISHPLQQSRQQVGLSSPLQLSNSDVSSSPIRQPAIIIDNSSPGSTCNISSSFAKQSSQSQVLKSIAKIAQGSGNSDSINQKMAHSNSHQSLDFGRRKLIYQ